MSLEELVSKYIASADHVFSNMWVSEVSLNVDVDDVHEVLQSAKAYLEDAKYYKDKAQYETSLTSIAYCEGLLDALRLLGAVRFEWPTRKRREK
jgi:FAD synthetase